MLVVLDLRQLARDLNLASRLFKHVGKCAGVKADRCGKEQDCPESHGLGGHVPRPPPSAPGANFVPPVTVRKMVPLA